MDCNEKWQKWDYGRMQRMLLQLVQRNGLLGAETDAFVAARARGGVLKLAVSHVITYCKQEFSIYLKTPGLKELVAVNKLELKHELENNYPHTEARLKRIECVYIPVTNAAVTKQFFMKHGLVVLSPQGNAKLASGQGIFFLETREKQTSNFVTHDWDEHDKEHEMESICFEVTRVDELHKQMKDAGAEVSELRGSGDCGLGFYFLDPDGNKYAAWQQGA